jgi:hypothetical protein
VHPAEVDAGEEDEGADRIDEVEGERQQQRDGQRRADAREHADERARQHPQQREEQVLRLQHRAEASMSWESASTVLRDRRQSRGQVAAEEGDEVDEPEARADEHVAHRRAAAQQARDDREEQGGGDQ